MFRWAHRWQAARQILLNATRSKVPFVSNVLLVATATASTPPSSPASSASATPASTSSSLTAKEDQECPWCTQMAAGPCADSFIAWRNCSKAIQEEERAAASAASSDAQAADGRSKSRAARECMPLFKIMNECVRKPGPNFDYYRQLLPLDDGQPTKEELIKDAQ